MKKKTKTLILSIVITLVLLLTFTVTYALFTYNETGNNTSQLIMGDIYMHYKENNQLILNNAMPQEGFKTLLTGYKVNPILADQDASDTTTELYSCINLFENEWEWYLDEGEDWESFCKGEGTSEGWTLQRYLDDMFTDEDYNELLSLNIIQEETLEYTSIKLNPEIATQTVEYENELTACVYFFDSMGINEALDEGSTTETFCQGTGTIMDGTTLQQFWDANNQQDGFMELFGNTLINNNIMVLENDLYVVNPNMANQTVGEINELMTCISIFTSEGYEFDEGTTSESFCKGEGTYDGGITLKGEFEGLKDNIDYMTFVGSKLLENNIILTSVDLPYFEFIISGKNTYSEQDIYYDVLLNHGDSHETRNTRLEDEFLKFRLVEVNHDKTEEIIFDGKSYSSLENKRVHVETISKNTMNEINKTYRLYMWIDEDVVIGNYDQDYTIEEWNDVFASVKVNVTGYFYNATDESCFTAEETIIYTHNTNMASDELATCVAFVSNFIASNSNWRWAEGTTAETFCQGTGIVIYLGYKFYTFQGTLDNSLYLFSDEDLVYLEENNILTSEFIGLSITDYDDTNCGTDVVIPKTINGNNVTIIEGYAFGNLTSVVVPNSVTRINDCAFTNNQLTSVIFEEDSELEYIGFNAFTGYSHNITEVTIPNSVTYLSCAAFDPDVLINASDSLSCTPPTQS